MNLKERKLVDDFLKNKKLSSSYLIKSKNKLLFRKFVKNFTVNIIKDSKYLVTLLNDAKERKDVDDLARIFFILFHLENYSEECVDSMVEVLKESWYHSHERIVELLMKVNSPKTIDVLYKTILTTFSYLDYDETGHNSLRLKCLITLWMIDTPEAKEKLKILTKSDNWLVKERARSMFYKNDTGPML